MASGSARSAQEGQRGGRLRGRAILALYRLLARLPLPALHRLGAGLGWLLYRVPNRAREAARTNLALCLPELGEAERERLLRDSLVETGKTVTEMAAMWFWPIDRVLGLVREESGNEHFERLRARGKGVILLSPHLGQWELVGLAAPRHLPLTSFYRPLRMRELDADITRARQRSGNRLVPTTGRGVREVYAAARRNEMVGILPDQVPPRGSGEFAPFFGVPAYTMVFVARMAARQRIGVLLTYAERLPGGRGFRLVTRPVEDAVQDADLQTALRAMNAAIERAIRQIPTQYQWTYKRFKRRPPGQPRLY